jgi:hypothetical protein
VAAHRVELLIAISVEAVLTSVEVVAATLAEVVAAILAAAAMAVAAVITGRRLLLLNAEEQGRHLVEGGCPFVFDFLREEHKT